MNEKNEEEKDTIGFLLIKYGIIAFFGGLFLMELTGNSPGQLIQRYKAKREMELIHYGGPVSEVNKYIDVRNKKVEELNALVQAKTSQLNTIFFYTNDSALIESALIQPNREYRDSYVDPYQIGRNHISECKEIIKYITEFQEKQDSLGYNLFIDRGEGNEFLGNVLHKKLMSEICIKHIIGVEEENKYKVVQLYYYTDDMKQHLTNQIQKKKPTSYIVSGSSPDKEIAALNEIQCASVVFTEEELQAQKVEYKGFQALFAPNFKEFPQSIYFFSCYNKKMDKVTFQEKVKLFRTMFLKKQSKKNRSGEIRSVSVTMNQS